MPTDCWICACAVTQPIDYSKSLLNTDKTKINELHTKLDMLLEQNYLSELSAQRPLLFHFCYGSIQRLVRHA